VHEQRTRRFGPIAPPPVTVVRWGEGEAFVVPMRVTFETAESLGREAIQHGVFRPADSHKADIETAQLVWVPLWRMDVFADGFHVGLRHATDSKGKLKWVLPTGGTRHRESIVISLGRKMLPFDPSPLISLPRESIVARVDSPITMGEVLDPDVFRDEAEREAIARLRREVLPGRAVYANATVHVRSAVLCHYPVWLRRYRYQGEAASTEPVEGHVALSAVDGHVVSERHPSGWRSLMGRAKRLFVKD
jgi:hypothetical protein